MKVYDGASMSWDDWQAIAYGQASLGCSSKNGMVVAEPGNRQIVAIQDDTVAVKAADALVG